MTRPRWVKWKFLGLVVVLAACAVLQPLGAVLALIDRDGDEDYN